MKGAVIISGVKLKILVNIRQGNSIQSSVQLLGCILIARGAEVEQRQTQNFESLWIV